MSRMDAARLAVLACLVLGLAGLTLAVFAGLTLSERAGRQAAGPGPAPAAREVLVEGQSAALAAQTFQRRVRSAAANAGVQITSVEVRPGQGDDGRHAVVISARAPNAAMMAFLHDLEAGAPATVVVEAVLARGGEDDSSGVLTLDAQFEAWPNRAGTLP